MFYTQVFALYEHLGRHVLHTGGDPPLAKSVSSAVRVLDFTYTLGVVFYNRGDQAGLLRVRETPSQAPSGFSRSVPSHTVRSRSFREHSHVAQGLRCSRSMEATQSYPNLLSEKQAAKRLGVARITLLRAREAGRIRFFRIGTRVLYCAEQLTEFLNGCERNRNKQSREAESQAPIKGNGVSSRRASVGDNERALSKSRSESRKKDQASLPFVAGN